MKEKEKRTFSFLLRDMCINMYVQDGRFVHKGKETAKARTLSGSRVKT